MLASLLDVSEEVGGSEANLSRPEDAELEAPVPETRGVLGRSGLLTIVEAVSAAGQFAISWGVARVMGVGALGTYGLVTSLTYLAQNMLMAGLEPLVMLGIVRGRRVLARSVGTALLGTTGLGVLLAGLVIVTTRALGYPSHIVTATTVAALGLIPELMRSTVEWTAVSLGRLRPVLVIRVGTSLLQLVLAGVVLLLYQSLPGLFGVTTVISTLGAAAYLVLLVRWIHPDRLETGRTDLVEWLRSIWPFVGFGVFGALSRRLDVPLLTQFAGLSAAGIYTAAFKIVRFLVIPRPAVFRGFFPVFVRQFDQGRERGLRMAQTLVRLLSVALCVSIIAIAAVAAPLVGWVYGPDFLPSARVLQIMLWGIPAFYVQSLAAGVLFANRQQREAVSVHAINLAFEVGLSLALVPRWGAAGMAVVYTLVRLVGVVQMWRMLHRRGVDLHVVRGFFGPVCLGLGVSLVAFLVSQTLGGVEQIGVAAAATAMYLLGALVLGFIRREDWDLLLRALENRSSSHEPVSETS